MSEFPQIDYLYTLNPPDGTFREAFLPVGEGLKESFNNSIYGQRT